MQLSCLRAALCPAEPRPWVPLLARFDGLAERLLLFRREVGALFDFAFQAVEHVSGAFQIRGRAAGTGEESHPVQVIFHRFDEFVETGTLRLAVDFAFVHREPLPSFFLLIIREPLSK